MKQTLYYAHIRDTQTKGYFVVTVMADNITHATQILRGQYGAANLVAMPRPK